MNFLDITVNMLINTFCSFTKLIDGILIRKWNLKWVESFLSAKKIEGCSEKTLKYYETTIKSMLDSIGKEIKYIVTDDIRCYLTEYQAEKNSSKVLSKTISPTRIPVEASISIIAKSLSSVQLSRISSSASSE